MKRTQISILLSILVFFCSTNLYAQSSCFDIFADGDSPTVDSPGDLLILRSNPGFFAIFRTVEPNPIFHLDQFKKMRATYLKALEQGRKFNSPPADGPPKGLEEGLALFEATALHNGYNLNLFENWLSHASSQDVEIVRKYFDDLIRDDKETVVDGSGPEIQSQRDIYAAKKLMTHLYLISHTDPKSWKFLFKHKWSTALDDMIFQKQEQLALKGSIENVFADNGWIPDRSAWEHLKSFEERNHNWLQTIKGLSVIIPYYGQLPHYDFLESAIKSRTADTKEKYAARVRWAARKDLVYGTFLRATGYMMTMAIVAALTEKLWPDHTKPPVFPAPPGLTKDQLVEIVYQAWRNQVPGFFPPSDDSPEAIAYHQNLEHMTADEIWTFQKTISLLPDDWHANAQ